MAASVGGVQRSNRMAGLVYYCVGVFIAMSWRVLTLVLSRRHRQRIIQAQITTGGVFRMLTVTHH